MITIQTRREFLRSIGVAASIFANGSNWHFGQSRESRTAFNLLVVGDSFIWGQGLQERDKSYTHVANWIGDRLATTQKSLNVKVKAHSGATIKFHKDASDAYKKAGRVETHPYPPEINIGFPSIWKQVEIAAEEYSSTGQNEGANIVLLSGGITDISVAKLLDPFGKTELLPDLIRKYCRDDMYDLLAHISSLNTNALIVVIGYFPIISAKTPASKLFNDWLETMSFPRILKPFANNPLTRPLIFRSVKKNAINTSELWLRESNENLKAAIEKLNTGLGKIRAIFVPSPITEDTCLETPNTLLFRMAKRGIPEDELFQKRKSECRTSLPELKKSTGLNYPVRYCEIAAVGHPNPAGAKAYADAVTAAIRPFLR